MWKINTYFKHDAETRLSYMIEFVRNVLFIWIYPQPQCGTKDNAFSKRSKDESVDHYGGQAV